MYQSLQNLNNKKSQTVTGTTLSNKNTTYCIYYRGLKWEVLPDNEVLGVTEATGICGIEADEKDE